MLTPGRDDVSNIHRRWSFTRINPSSSKISYAIWIACAVIIVVITHIYYLQASMAGLVIFLPLGITSLLGSHVLDYVALRRTPGNKLSKIAHVSAFANILWALTVVLGVAADFVFSKPPGMNYVIAGMLLAVGLRIDIFTSVFGASTRRAIIVSFIQPLIFLLAFVPPSFFYSILIKSFVGLGFGAIFIALAIVWALIADKAGRPGVKSTFVLMQAFLVAWTENRVDMMEDFLEAKAHDSLVTTRVIRFFSAGNDAAIVLPDVHPGPFSAVGGSNLPYVLYERFSKRALIMHSISDHSLNIPSKRLLEKYLKDLGRMRAVKTGDTCSAPVQVKINNSTSTGIAFGNSAIVMLSLAPNGMEDIPQSVRGELESYGGTLAFSDVLVVDCHNAMGKNLQDSDRRDLIESAKRCLEQLKKQPQKGFKVGFASLDNIQHRVPKTDELGSGGLASLVICVDDRNYAIGWADSNNMENKLRDYVISKVRDNVTMLEVCSSDTHSTSGKRTREGYFALGTTSNPQDIAETYVELCAKAIEMAAKSTFELASTQSAIRVMGKKLFEDVSSALDRSMNITKIFVAITVATYIAMLVLS
jgi:putative membrane protein